MSFTGNEETRVYWVPQADPEHPDNPSAARLEGGTRLDGFLASPPVPDFAETTARVARILAETAGIPFEMRSPVPAPPEPPTSLGERFTPRLGDLLSRVDRAIDGLCPCGAEPRDGSAYCSYDCEPNICGQHTDTREYGDLATPMRWRPDLVSDDPDEDLTPIDIGERFDSGDGLFRSMCRRSDGRVHLRLDDGTRFVGCDVAEEFQTPDGYTATWERLERELGNPRHAVPAVPDPDSFIESVLPLALAAGFLPRTENPDTLWSRRCGACRSSGEPFSTPTGDWCCWCWSRLPGPPLSLSISVDHAGTRHMQLGAVIGSEYRSVERVVTEADMVSEDAPLDAVRSRWAEMEDELLAAAGIVRATARRPIAAGQLLTADDIEVVRDPGPFAARMSAAADAAIENWRTMEVVRSSGPDPRLEEAVFTAARRPDWGMPGSLVNEPPEIVTSPHLPPGVAAVVYNPIDRHPDHPDYGPLSRRTVIIRE